MNIGKLQQLVDTTAAQDNGVSGIYVLDKRGESLVTSLVRGVDGSIDNLGIEDSVASLVQVKEILSTGQRTDLGDFQYLLIGFEQGELIITIIGNTDEPITIIFVNLDSKKSGAARRTARLCTPQIKTLL